MNAQWKKVLKKIKRNLKEGFEPLPSDFKLIEFPLHHEIRVVAKYFQGCEDKN
jgi:hypothetical protein